MNRPQPSTEFLEAAAFALVVERCRDGHLHDLRGELQALNSSVELLVRAAQAPAQNTGFADKAAVLARKALNVHEKSIVSLIDLVVPRAEPNATLNLAELVGGVTRFLRNDALKKSLVVRVEAAADTVVAAAPNRCKVVLLGLSALTLDAAPAGGSIVFGLTRDDTWACIEWRLDFPGPGTTDGQRDIGAGNSLILEYAAHWAWQSGGRLERAGPGADPHTLRLFLPIALCLGDSGA